MKIQTKICGLSTKESVDAAVQGGAAYVGFVFFPPSPRAINPDVLPTLTADVPETVSRVGLFVDPTPEQVRDVVDTGCLDMLQFHGTESPGQVAQFRDRFGLPVMKAIPISSPEDVGVARTYEVFADKLLFDAKPPKGATRPGGNALSFDWRLIADVDWVLPWVLAGGLNAENLAEAISVSGAGTVDISSGVEDTPGVKNVDQIQRLLKIAAAL